MRKNPSAYLHTLSALDLAFGPTSEVVIVGGKVEKETKNMLKVIRDNYLPRVSLLLKHSEELDQLSNLTKDLKSIDGRTTAYVCSKGACHKPITDATELLKTVDPC